MAILLSLKMGSPFIHPDLILDVMTRKEIMDWVKIYEDQPFGEEREDERAELVSWFAFSSFSGGKGLSELMRQFRREGASGEVEQNLREAREYALAKNKARKKRREERKKKQEASLQEQTKNLRPKV